MLDFLAKAFSVFGLVSLAFLVIAIGITAYGYFKGWNKEDKDEWF